jgi:hypothetical protein
MKTWVRKTLTVGALAAGTLMFAPGGAAYASNGQSGSADTAKHSTVSSTVDHHHGDRGGHGDNRHDRRHGRWGHRNSCDSDRGFFGHSRNRCDFRWGRDNGFYDDVFFGGVDDIYWDDDVLCEDGIRRPYGNLGAGHHPAGYGDLTPGTAMPTGVSPAGVKPAHVKPAHVKPAGIKPAGVMPATAKPTRGQPGYTVPTGVDPTTAPTDAPYTK